MANVKFIEMSATLIVGIVRQSNNEDIVALTAVVSKAEGSITFSCIHLSDCLDSCIHVPACFEHACSHVPFF